jgi:hypothetical protein
MYLIVYKETPDPGVSLCAISHYFVYNVERAALLKKRLRPAERSYMEFIDER